jgi:hypothetical protein
MRIKEICLAFLVLSAALVGMGQVRRVIRGSSWFEDNVSVSTTATQVLNAIGLSGTAPVPIIPTDSGVALSFSAATRKASITLTGAVTFTTASLTPGPNYELAINNAQATNCPFTWPTNWVWIGIKPGYETLGKSARLSLESWGTNDASIYAIYGEQP